MSTSLKLKLIEDGQAWEKFILSVKGASFLQSWHWAEFSKSLGKIVLPVGIFDQSGRQKGAALLIKEEAKRGNYLTIAAGPVINWSEISEQHLKQIFKYFVDLAKQADCVFIRFRPQALDTAQLRQQMKIINAQPAPMHLTADLTLQLDLSLSEEELLKQMRKNTRYEVRKSKKLGIEIKTSQDPKQIKEFHQHQLFVAEKHNFVPFSYQFLHQQFKQFAANDLAMLFHSYHQEKLLASAFIIFYNREAVYHYGISTADNHRLPGSYACQWASILEAKKRSCRVYNFWGIAPKEAKDHRFAGVSIFKRGFGGQEVAYLPAHDIAIKSSYILTKGFELLRKKVRKL